MTNKTQQPAAKELTSAIESLKDLIETISLAHMPDTERQTALRQASEAIESLFSLEPAQGHAASKDEHLWIFSMGKRFRVRGIFTSDEAANNYMRNHDEAALIAQFGPFRIVANKYEGIREQPR